MIDVKGFFCFFFYICAYFSVWLCQYYNGFGEIETLKWKISIRLNGCMLACLIKGFSAMLIFTTLFGEMLSIPSLWVNLKVKKKCKHNMNFMETPGRKKLCQCALLYQLHVLSNLKCVLISVLWSFLQACNRHDC